MKKIVILFFSVCSLSIKAQQYGAQWILSPNSSWLDFRIDSVARDTIGGNMNTWKTLADICDSSGNLLYFTNGFYIADKNGNVLPNGDTLSPNPFTTENYWQGDPLPQAALFLPEPDSSRYYYLFHYSEDTNSRPQTVYYSLIDAQGNGGLGAVIKKNIPILQLHGDTMLRGGG